MIWEIVWPIFGLGAGATYCPYNDSKRIRIDAYALYVLFRKSEGSAHIQY